MRRVVLSVAILIAGALTIMSCNNNSPKAVADKFLTSLYHYDYEAAKEVSTEETRRMLDMIAQFSNAMPDCMKQQAKKVTVDIKDIQEEGDKATVRYTTSDDEKSEKTIHLVKQEGQWLVQWSKMDAEEGAGAEEPGEVPPMDEASQASPADGTKADTTMKE